MVTVSIYFEGGTDPRANPNAATIDNTARLRESFNKLLNSGLHATSVKIQAIPSYSQSNVKSLAKRQAGDGLFLLDLDGPPENKDNFLSSLELFELKHSIFFMVQAMEAWILSQPDKIELAFDNYRRRISTAVGDDELIKGKNLEYLDNPDGILTKLLQKYFYSIKDGKDKPLKYYKLKNAPEIVERLDIHRLQNDFIDVRLLLQRVFN